jgi:hypothetical protein
MQRLYHRTMRRPYSLLSTCFRGAARISLFPRAHAPRSFYRRAPSAEEALRADWDAVEAALESAYKRERARFDLGAVTVGER